MVWTRTSSIDWGMHKGLRTLRHPDRTEINAKVKAMQVCLRNIRPLFRAIALTALPAATAFAQPAASAPADSAPRARAAAAIHRGSQYFLAARQSDGGWESDKGPGITALVIRALAQDPRIGPGHTAVLKGAELVLASQRDDGGVYSAMGLFKNYETCVALSALAVVKHEAAARATERAQKFLIENQADEDHGAKSVDDVWYGGAGYALGKRPDLSNTQMMLDALHDSGLPKDHPTYKKALVFIQRCQMSGELNDQEFSKGSTQGGFIYSAAGGGESKAGKIEINGRSEPRCYGSMTYAGVKSMIYCGLTKNDPKVKAALEWIRSHWTLEYNPNMPEKQSHEGLFYFYHTFARTLAALDEPIIRDAQGRNHDWREELLTKLENLQRPDGSWINESDRWMEGMPALTTAYAMLALEAAYFPPTPAEK